MNPRRTALVTGANRGLGAAVAARLYELGYDVVLSARDREAAERSAKALGARVRAVRLDVTDPDDVSAARETVGPIDILVSNAGIMLDMGQSPSGIDLGLVERHLAVNAVGAWRVAQAFLPGMVERRWGRVVTVSSGTGSFANGLFTGAPAYALSKAALNAVTVLLAREAEGSGVLVNAVNPGLVRTRMRPDAERTPAEAAEDVVWAATLPDDGPTGAFLRSGRRIDW